MPPKKLKDLASAPVYRMPHEQQVRLLSDALLREYMHRRGYLATLQAFDEENPRQEETISSRALMSDLLAVEPADSQRLKDEGITTLMEMLCDLRVERRLETEQLLGDANIEVPAAPSEEELQDAKDAVQRARDEAAAHSHSRKEKKSARHKDKHKDKEKKKKKRKPDAMVVRGDGENGGDDDDDNADARRSKKSHKSKKSRKSEGTGGAKDDEAALDDLIGSGDPASSHDSSASRSSSRSDSGDARGPAQQQSTKIASAPSPSSTKSASGPSWLQEKNSAGRPSLKTSQAGQPSEDAGEESSSGEDEESEDEHVQQLLGELDGSAIGADVAAAVCELITGSRTAAPPDAFLQQGFAFDDNGLPCALVQWRRGTGAVLAPVQALVLSFYYEKEVYMTAAARQRDCLRRALTTILLRAQPEPAKVVIVAGVLRRKHPRRDLPQRLASANAFTALRGFSSEREITDALGSMLDGDDSDDNGAPSLSWMQPHGSGLWCFLLSLCLSRGVDALRKDMTGTGSGTADDGDALISSRTGDAGRALAHLLITGRATPLPLPRGTAPQPSGFLDADASSADTGSWSSALANPAYPSWVVHHAGHYSNLYMKKDGRKPFRQKRELGGAASAELYYWDPLTEEDEYRLLAVVQDGGVGEQRRSASSFVADAIHSVADWRGARVDWCGAAPVR